MIDNMKISNNSLSLIRIIAALQVMYGHIIGHLELTSNNIVNKVIWYFNGVPIFFIISGFLIWFSMERSTSYSNYICKRFWRIYPELWVAVVIEILCIIIMYNEWRPKDLIMFAIAQGTVFQFWTPDTLRGYGCGTPNGTLWTICVMIQFYIVAWGIRKLLYNKKIITWLLFFGLLVSVSVLGDYLISQMGYEAIGKLYNITIVRFCWLFFVGCFIAEFKELLMPMLMKYWYLILIVGIIPYLSQIDISARYGVISSIMLGGGLIGFAYKFPQMLIKIDISYGIFLYHMIVVNVFISLGRIGKWWNAISVLIITVLLAGISTLTVGKWAGKMKLKRK